MRLGWGVSGAGMVARAVFQAQQAGIIETVLAAVVLQRPSSMQDYCYQNDIPVSVPADRAALTGELARLKVAHQLDWLGLTFDRLLTGPEIDLFERRVFNLHMSLLPDFPGRNATAAALRAGVATTGVTAHLVDEGMDTGGIIAQSPCAIESGDTVETLGRKQFERAVPLVLQILRELERCNLGVTDGQARWKVAGYCDRLIPDADIAAFATDYCATVPVLPRP